MCVRRREFSRARGDRGKEYHFDLKRIAADARAVAMHFCVRLWRFDDSRPNNANNVAHNMHTRRNTSLYYHVRCFKLVKSTIIIIIVNMFGDWTLKRQNQFELKQFAHSNAPYFNCNVFVRRTLS